MARKKQAAKQRRGATRRAKSPVATAEIAPMALELYSAVGAMLKHYGFTGPELKQAFERSQRSRSVPPASTQWGNELRPVGNLMAAWTEELPYVDESGKPRALDIKGRGATFESLAKRFFRAAQRRRWLISSGDSEAWACSRVARSRSMAMRS